MLTQQVKDAKRVALRHAAVFQHLSFKMNVGMIWDFLYPQSLTLCVTNARVYDHTPIEPPLAGRGYCTEEISPPPLHASLSCTKAN